MNKRNQAENPKQVHPYMNPVWDGGGTTGGWARDNLCNKGECSLGVCEAVFIVCLLHALWTNSSCQFSFCEILPVRSTDEN